MASWLNPGQNFSTGLLTHLHIASTGGKSFTVEHALSGPFFGGFPTLHHNEIWNLTANLLSEVCHNVTIEPTLQPVTRETFKLASASLTLEQDQTLQLMVSGVATLKKRFLTSESLTHLLHLTPHPHPVLATADMKKKNKEHMSNASGKLSMPLSPKLYSPLRMGPIAISFYKRLADLLASKWNSYYSQTIGWLRCRLSFSLLRSSILCIRGARSSKARVPCSVPFPVDLVHSESRFTLD